MKCNQRKKQKMKPWFLLNPKHLAEEVSRYGYTFSMKGFWKRYLLGIIGILLLCLFYQMQPFFTGMVLMVTAFLSPAVILLRYQSAYEQKRFLDVSNYLEQLLYSFQRVPKIMTALEDALVVFPEGSMHDLVQQTMENIQTKEVSGDVYEGAFTELEEAYHCRRLVQAHAFLIKVERLGGDFSTAIKILLEDRQMWVSRVYEMAQERKVIGRNILISILLSVGICKMASLMLPKALMNPNHVLSQLVTAVFIISGLLLWYLSQKRLKPDWLSDAPANEEELKRLYTRITDWDPKKERKKTIKKLIVAAPVVLLCLHLKNLPLLLLSLAAGLWILVQPNVQLRQAKRRVTREIDKAFPIWMMEISLLLQTENVHNALAKSLEQAPYILREELTRMVEGIEQNPNSIKPYLDFMPWLDLPEVQSALRLLYSMAEFGGEEQEKQIGILVERNHRLLDKAERLANEDSLAGIGAFALLPMLTGSVKMMVDMGLLLVSLLDLSKAIT